MQEYETFVYLDVQKTGSSFISRLLRKFCKENLVHSDQHEGMPADCDRSKLYFISVRDPLDQYLSLYSFGCQTKGELFQHLLRQGYGDYYDGTWSGFRSWLDFMLDAGNAKFLGGGYGGRQSGRLSKCVGLQSYRVLTMAVPDARRALADCESKENVSTIYKSENLVGFTVRCESLRRDLEELMRTRLHNSILNLDEVLRYIHGEEPFNASDRIDRYFDDPKLGKKLQSRLEEREWLLYEEFYRAERA